MVDEVSRRSVFEDPLPHALEMIDEVLARAKGKQVAVFLDYDGTLTPIVDRPQDANLSGSMRAAVARLAEVCIVGVISGRDLEDVRSRMDLPQLFYAGSHGFDIRGPGVVRQLGTEARPALQRVAERLRESLAKIGGAIIEPKRFSVAVHYRLVSAHDVEPVSEAVNTAIESESELKRFDGKKVIEIQPKIDWHKGKALMTLLQTLGLHERSAMPLYLGDDTTDENAFRAIAGFGMGIVVRDQAYETAAAYALSDPDEVEDFLTQLAESIRNSKAAAD